MNSLNDKELIRLAKKHRTPAFEILIQRHQDAVFNLSLRLLGNYHCAQEVAQDTFVKAFRSIKSFKGKSQFSTWLYRICYNTCISYLKKNKVETVSLEKLHSVPDESVGQRNPMEQSDRKKYVNQAISKLHPTDATIVSLYYIEDFSTQEIAKVVKLSDGNVRVRLHRARKQLQQELESILKHEVANL